MWLCEQSLEKNKIRASTRENFAIQLAYALRRTGCLTLSDLAAAIAAKRPKLNHARLARELSAIANGGGSDLGRIHVYLLLHEVAGGRAPAQFRAQMKKKKFVPSRLSKGLAALRMEATGETRTIRSVAAKNPR